MGSLAWREYDPDNAQLPLATRESVECVPYDTQMTVRFDPGDTACEGDKYVWRCREVSAADWCTIHPPASAYGYLAWELLNGRPNPVSEDVLIRERAERPYVPPSDAEL